MVVRKTLGEKIFDVLNIILLAGFSFACIAPVLHVLFASFSEPTRLMQTQGLILKPLGFTIKGYELVFRIPGIVTGYKNTIFYVVFGTIINIFMTSIGAYVLTFTDWWYVKFLMIMVTITMFFGGGLIPTYLTVKSLGMVDTIWAILIPGAISVWNLIMMRTSFLAIPASLKESARIDGASEWTILFRIILPLSKAVIAVMVLYYSVGHWNSWFNAMIYLRDRSKFPLQIILREILFQENQTTSVSVSQFTKIINVNELDLYKPLVRYTTIIVATLPVLFFYPFVQKHFIKGVMVGSLKE
jgi:putative aldouronate transport system permease protein